jgi:hypothetical protein
MARLSDSSGLQIAASKLTLSLNHMDDMKSSPKCERREV